MACVLRSLVGLQSVLYTGAGGALLAGGCLLGLAEFQPWEDSQLGRLAVACIVIGGLLLLLGVLGLASTCTSSSSLAYTFSLILLILVIGQILCTLLLLLLSGPAEEATRSMLQRTMSYYSPAPDSPLSSALTTAWVWTQDTLGCCGVSSPSTDWQTWGPANSSSEDLPACATPAPTPAPAATLRLPAHESLATHAPRPAPAPRGCLQALGHLLARHPVVVLTTLGGLLGAQVLVLCLSCCLARLHQARECSRRPQ